MSARQWLAILLSILLLVTGCVVKPLPVPTPTPAPRSTAVPTATPAPAQASPSAAGQELGETAMVYVRDFVRAAGARPATTDREVKAASYIADELTALGYRVLSHEFSVRYYSTEVPGLQVLSNEGKAVDAIPLYSSKTGEVTGPLVLAGLGRKEDLPSGGVRGRVALIERGQLSFRDKVANVAGAGATAAVIYNNDAGNFRGDLADPGAIPAVSISREDGLILKGLLEQQKEVAVKVAVELVSVPSQNIVATRAGSQDRVIVVGAHYDSVEVGTGANDNGSGVAALLALASYLSKKDLPLSVRLVFFGSEELGLIGSGSYVRDLQPPEREKIIAMINLDTVGSGAIGIAGYEDLVKRAERVAFNSDVPVTISRSQQDLFGSDHATFLSVGIPAVFIFGMDFSRIHTQEDVIDFVKKQTIQDAITVALALIEDLGREAR